MLNGAGYAGGRHPGRMRPTRKPEKRWGERRSQPLETPPRGACEIVLGTSPLPWSGGASPVTGEGRETGKPGFDGRTGDGANRRLAEPQAGADDRGATTQPFGGPEARRRVTQTSRRPVPVAHALGRKRTPCHGTLLRRVLGNEIFQVHNQDAC
jgi:hypothetical protein